MLFDHISLSVIHAETESADFSVWYRVNTGGADKKFDFSMMLHQECYSEIHKDGLSIIDLIESYVS